MTLVESSSMADLLRTGTEDDDGEGPLTERGRAVLLLSASPDKAKASTLLEVGGSSTAGGRILPVIQWNRDIDDGFRGVAGALKFLEKLIAAIEKFYFTMKDHKEKPYVVYL